MKKIREILRLTEESQLSQRQIGKALNISRPVIAQAIQKIQIAGITYAQIRTMPDSELATAFSDVKRPVSKSAELKKKFPYFTKELKRTGVTLKHLWEEYLEENPQGLMYTQFCYHYQQWRKDEKLSMHIEHKAGDKMFVDYTGESFLKMSKRVFSKLCRFILIPSNIPSQIHWFSLIIILNSKKTGIITAFPII
jgi:DNA-binding Lrp family transcriptional regulator